MTDETSDGGIIIDSDWKEEAAREKERLAGEEQAQQPKTAEGASPAGVSGGFHELVSTLAMQAAVALGGMQTPTGERMPPNPEAARHYIDMIGVLEDKTKGNLTPEESQMVTAVLQDLRTNFVQMTGGAPPPPNQPAQDEPAE